MKLQLHHQYKDGTTQPYSQREFDTFDDEEINKWVKDVQQIYPVPKEPKGVMWVMVEEGSPLFAQEMPVFNGDFLVGNEGKNEGENDELIELRKKATKWDRVVEIANNPHAVDSQGNEINYEAKMIVEALEPEANRG